VCHKLVNQITKWCAKWYTGTPCHNLANQIAWCAVWHIGTQRTVVDAVIHVPPADQSLSPSNEDGDQQRQRQQYPCRHLLMTTISLQTSYHHHHHHHHRRRIFLFIYWPHCRRRVGSSHSGCVSLGTLLFPLQRRTITVSLPPHLDHYWRKPVGRPRTTWLRTIDDDLQSLNFGVHPAWRKARDRDAWHQVVSMATLHPVVLYTPGGST